MRRAQSFGPVSHFLSKRSLWIARKCDLLSKEFRRKVQWQFRGRIYVDNEWRRSKCVPLPPPPPAPAEGPTGNPLLKWRLDCAWLPNHFGAFLRANFAGRFLLLFNKPSYAPRRQLAAPSPVRCSAAGPVVMSFYNVPVLIWFLSPMSTNIPRIPKRIDAGTGSTCQRRFVKLSYACRDAVQSSPVQSGPSPSPADILAEILITGWRMVCCGCPLEVREKRLYLVYGNLYYDLAVQSYIPNIYSHRNPLDATISSYSSIGLFLFTQKVADLSWFKTCSSQI